MSIFNGDLFKHNLFDEPTIGFSSPEEPNSIDFSFLEESSAPLEESKEVSVSSQEDDGSDALFPEIFIAKGLSIEGNLTAKGNVKLFGTLTGDLNSDGDVFIDSDVCSNITAKNVFLNSGCIKGNVFCEGQLVINEGTSVTGDFKAESIVLNGSLNGKGVVQKMTVVNTNAVLTGDLTTGAISIQTGSTIDCNLHTKNLI